MKLIGEPIDVSKHLRGVMDDNDWTFLYADTRTLTHCFHDYPARMIPQVAGKLLDLYGAPGKLLLDPYCGVGTSLVEAARRGINSIGSDINPLAALIAEAKVSVSSTKTLNTTRKAIARFSEYTKNHATRVDSVPDSIAGITNLGFWFNPEILPDLVFIKQFVDRIRSRPTSLFFKTAFSETVRESSNTRLSEFKLYRYAPEKLRNWHPQPIEIMQKKLNRNLAGAEEFVAELDSGKTKYRSKVLSFNSVVEIPVDDVSPESVDIVITSPPYGDSHTTVAYGQFSRLSAAWLGLPNPAQVDGLLMGGGGRRKKNILPTGSSSIDTAIRAIAAVDVARANEVYAFYADLGESIAHVASRMKHGGYVCYVVGNRRVKSIELPTDAFIRDKFSLLGFEHMQTAVRSIPNKRMPSVNSPTNVAGAVDPTMTTEYIVVMRR